MTPPPHTNLHAWRAPEAQRNGDLVVPLLNAGGDVLPLRGSRLMWEQFTAAIAQALKAERTERAAGKGARSQESGARKPVTKPNGRVL
jgi:hypothetical protein